MAPITSGGMSKRSGVPASASGMTMISFGSGTKDAYAHTNKVSSQGDVVDM